MAGKAEYRSAIRSRRLIREAFLALLEEKDYHQITVTDIVKRADLNRATFYAHYPDVPGLMESFENEILSQMMDTLSHVTIDSLRNNPLPLFQETNRFLTENLDFCRILLRANGSAAFLEHMKRTFITFILNDEKLPESLRHSRRFQLRVRFFAGGVVDMYREWITGEADCTLEEMTNELMGIVIHLVSEES